jgi:hypothetical protein
VGTDIAMEDPMFQQNQDDFSSCASVDKQGKKLVYFPDDSGQALTTIHCRRTTAKSVRTTTVRENMPLAARKGYNEKRDAYFSDMRQADKAVKTAKLTRKFDGFLTEDGEWAMHCVVNVETWEVIKCEYTTKNVPTCRSIMRKYGSYARPGMSFTSAYGL